MKFEIQERFKEDRTSAVKYSQKQPRFTAEEVRARVEMRRDWLRAVSWRPSPVTKEFPSIP